MPKEDRSAEYQRRQGMSQDERNRLSRDGLAKSIHEQNQRDGKNTTFDEAHRKACETANRVERKKGG